MKICGLKKIETRRNQTTQSSYREACHKLSMKKKITDIYCCSQWMKVHSNLFPSKHWESICMQWAFTAEFLTRYHCSSWHLMLKILQIECCTGKKVTWYQIFLEVRYLISCNWILTHDWFQIRQWYKTLNALELQQWFKKLSWFFAIPSRILLDHDYRNFSLQSFEEVIKTIN